MRPSAWLERLVMGLLLLSGLAVRVYHLGFPELGAFTDGGRCVATVGRRFRS